MNTLNTMNTSIFDSNITDIIDVIYPVGAIYLSVSDVSPEILFGGTWEQLKDRFLLAAGDSYDAGATGGESSHALSVSEMPSHQHSIQHYYGTDTGYVPANSIANSVSVRTDTGGIGNTGGTFTDRNSGDYKVTSFIGYVGDSAAHNNMPPYLAVYMWKRIA